MTNQCNRYGNLLAVTDLVIFWLVKIQQNIAMFIFLGMIALNVWEVFSRYAIGRSIFWIQEVTLLMLTYVVFLGFTSLTYYKKDINVAFIMENLPKGFQRVISIIGKCFVLFFLSYFSRYAYILFIRQIGDVSLVARIPLHFYTLPLVISGGTMLIIYFREFILEIINVGKYVRKKFYSDIGGS